MNTYKNCTPAEDGYFWYRKNDVQPCVARITTPAENLRCEADPDAKLVLFVGDSEPIWEWELGAQYEFAGPIFPPTDWPLNFEAWPE